jgi:hypothetical protein
MLYILNDTKSFFIFYFYGMVYPEISDLEYPNKELT